MTGVDLWLVSNRAQSISVEGLVKVCDERQEAGALSYKFVPTDSFVFGMKDGRLYLRVENEEIQEDDLPKIAYFYLRMSLDALTFELNIMRHLETMGVTVINSPQAFVSSRSKMYQLQLVASVGVAIPDTFTHCHSDVTALENLVSADLGQGVEYPAIIKKNIGSKGDEVMLVQNQDTATDFVNHLRSGTVYLRQGYVRSSHGKHVRVVVVNHKVVHTYTNRNIQNSRVQSNMGQGGVLEHIDCDEQLTSAALKVASVLDYDIIGIDFLLGEDGSYVFCEANVCPGMVQDRSLLGRVVDYLTSRAKQKAT